MVLDMLSDEVLGECARQGTHEARAVLLSRYADPVYNVVYNLSGGSREAEELTYQTLTSAIVEGWSQELKGDFRICLFRTAIQAAMGAARRRPSRLFDVPHLAGRLREALDDVDEVDRAAFVLCDLVEMPTEEAAAVLQRSPRDIRQSVHCTRLTLIDALNGSSVRPSTAAAGAS